MVMGQVTVVEDHTVLGQLRLERRAAVAGPGLQHDVEVHGPADTPHHPDQLVVPVAGRPGNGTMKSVISPTPSSVRKRVIRTAVSGM